MTLQQQWDIWLVASFAKYPSAHIFKCVGAFAKRMGLSTESEQISSLKRMPKSGSNGAYCQVSRFVCGYIPGASDYIFDSDKNVIQKAMLIARSDSVAVAVDEKKCQSESREKSLAKKDLKNANVEYQVGRTMRGLSARRNWSACK